MALNKLVLKCPRCGHEITVGDRLGQQSPVHEYLFAHFAIIRCPKCGYVFEHSIDKYIK